MPRTDHDRVRISFHIAKAGLAAVDERATALGWTRAEMLRYMLAYAHEQLPRQKRKARR